MKNNVQRKKKGAEKKNKKWRKYVAAFAVLVRLFNTDVRDVTILVFG